MAECPLARNASSAGPNDKHQFAFIIELLTLSWPHERRLMPRERARRPQEQARIFRQLRTVAIFFIAVRVVHADANDLLRLRQERQVCQPISAVIGRAASRKVGKTAQLVRS